MAKAFAAGETAQMRRLFHAGFALILLSCFAMMAAATIAVVAVPIARILHLEGQSVVSARGAILLICTQLILNLLLGVVNAGLSAVGRYAIPELISGTRNTLELVLLAIALHLSNIDLLGASLLYAASAALTLATSFIIFVHVSPGRESFVGLPDLPLLRSLLGPMLGALAINFSYNGVVIQLPRLILSALLGPIALANFTMCVQLLRIVRMAIEIPSTLPVLEAVHAFFEGSAERAMRLIVQITRASFYMAICLGIGAVWLGPFVIAVWTNGRVHVDRSVVAILATSTVIYAAGLPSLEVLLGTNSAQRTVTAFAAMGLPFVALCYLLTRHLGTDGTAVSVFCLEALFAGILSLNASRLLNVEALHFARSALTLNVGDIRSGLGAMRKRFRCSAQG